MTRVSKLLLTIAALCFATPAFPQVTNPPIGSLKWFVPTESQVMSLTPGTNGLVFASTWDEMVYAIDLATAQVRWQSNFPGTRYGGPLVVAPDNTLLVASILFRAIDGNTGLTKWSHDFSSGSGAAAVDRNGTVFVAAENLYALDVASGNEKWSFHRDDISSPPALSADGYVYVASYRGGLIAVDAVTGQRQWSFRKGAQYSGAPAIGPDGTVYAQTQHGTLISFDGITGRPNWVVETNLLSKPPIMGVDGTIYLPGWDGTLSAIDPRTGGQLWQTKLPSYLEGVTLPADGTIYATVPNQFFAVNSTNGATNLLFQTKARFSDIHLAPDGTILLPSWGQNGVFALHGTSPLASSAWPKALQNGQNSSHWQLTGPPRITRQPASQWIARGSNAALRFYSPAVRPLQVQWFFNGSPLTGATNEVLRLNDAQFGNAGRYSVTISNQFGGIASDEAEVFVGYSITVRTHGPGAVERDAYQAAYATNSTVQLSAVPAPDRKFLGWSGAVTSAQPVLNITLLSNVVLTATFEYQPGDLLWELPESFGATPALGTNGVLYGGHWNSRAIAVNAATGEILWDVPMNGEVNISPSIAHDGTIFVGTYGSSVNALDGRTGTRKWSFNVNICVHSCPAVGVNGTAYFAGDKVYAVDVATGTEKWSFGTNGVFETSPAIGADNTVYIGSWNGRMYAFDGASGRKKWEFATGGRIDSSAAIGANGLIYFGSADYNVYALHPQTGAKVWEFDTGAEAYGSPTIGPEGTVYITSANYKMYALNGETGAKLWEYVANDFLSSSSVLTADGTLLFATRSLGGFSTLLAFETWGDEKWRVSFPGESASPTVGLDGTIYFAGRALHGNSPPANSPWPKAHGRLDNRGRVRANPLFDRSTAEFATNAFSVTLHTEPDERVAIEWTSDWNIWTALPMVTNSTGTLRLTDPTTGVPLFRLYRARVDR